MRNAANFSFNSRSRRTLIVSSFGLILIFLFLVYVPLHHDQVYVPLQHDQITTPLNGNCGIYKYSGLSSNSSNHNDENDNIKRLDYKRTVCSRFNDSEFIKTSSLLRKQQYDINVYLRALYNGVEVIPVPESETLLTAISDCKIKPQLDYSQHSVEQKFPELLAEMSKFRHRKGSLLWRNQSDPSTALNIFAEPVLFYLQTNLYFVIIHTRIGSGNDKENWEAGIQYFKDTADAIVTTYKWNVNMGIDFISPASHPMSGPMRVHPTSLNFFIRQTFLRTDFDFSGHAPKDIIIPYYVPPARAQPSYSIETSNRTILFFAGGDNPIKGLRSLFEKSFIQSAKRFNTNDVFFSVSSSSSSSSSSLSSEEYSRRMGRADFCLMLRGDTASSKRLFSAVSHGCIPVIISDWIPLPFEALLDYSQFTLRFSESAFHDVGALLAYLRTEVGPARKAALRRNLLTARSLLLFQPAEAEVRPGPGPDRKNSSRGVECFLLNPVSLTLVEAFIRRKEYCDELSSPQSSVLCVRLYGRLAAALEEEKAAAHFDRRASPRQQQQDGQRRHSTLTRQQQQIQIDFSTKQF